VGENNPHIIGLTGSFGSGCTYIADHILANNGYTKVSLSDLLRQMYQESKGQKPERGDLQKFGDELRRETKEHGYLAKRAVEHMGKHGSGAEKWVIDSIRNPAEVQVLRDESRNFYLVGVFADKETRWNRVRGNYENDRNAFEAHDENDTGMHNEPFGQRVSDCYYEADVVVSNARSFSQVGNQDFKDFSTRTLEYVDLLQEPLSNRQATRNDEAMMAMAYAVGQRSSCPQRKVGAVIADGHGHAISSGFNEVPPGEKPCIEEHTECYRSVQRKAFFDYLSRTIPDFEKSASAVEAEFRNKFRILDICRALHAEETAILNLARTGKSVAGPECTLYTTTFPCRLCANKIAQLGIGRVVYLEPYPGEEAKMILNDGGVKSEFFEGITFRAYFRVYGDKR